MTERKLATVRTIAEVKSIEGADKICAYRTDSWWVVDQVGKYQVGDMVIYCEVDSWMPHALAPFLSKGKEPHEYEGVKGERLRTVRLRGQLSQGLLLPLEPTRQMIESELFEGLDVTYPLGILKWERPINAQLAGLVRGNFPPEIPKTNQERIQNLTKEFAELQQYRWAVTEKLHGMSCTYFLDNTGDFHVCSRNLDLKPDENNLYWKIAIENDIENKMRNLGLLGHAIQGEIIGEGIQGNQYKRKPVFHLFDVFSVALGNYLSLSTMRQIATQLDIRTVPVLSMDFSLEDFTIDALIKFADNESQLNYSQREGLVLQCLEYPEKSFKIISDEWLLKNE